MRKVMAMGVVLAGIVASTSTPAQIPPAYFDGNQYHRMDEIARTIYIEGVIDGFLGSYLLDSNMKREVALGTCVKNMPADQARAIVDKYVSENPDQWGWQMTMLVYNGLNGACRKQGISIR